MTEVTQGRPTVLVVDDEEDLRDIMRRMLERRGFAALVAADSEAALAVCREHPGVIDVLVTDLSMPGTSGGDLARLASELRPEMSVVYISGMSRDLAVTKGLIGPYALLVQKPFTADLLLGALHSVLGRRASAV